MFILKFQVEIFDEMHNLISNDIWYGKDRTRVEEIVKDSLKKIEKEITGSDGEELRRTIQELTTTLKH